MSGGLVAGDRLGRFVIVRALGAGGMGTVYQARDPELGRDVALKLLHDDRGDPARLLREAQALAALSHPNVVTVHELGSQDGQVFLAMELVDGESLDQHLAVLERTGGRRRWRRVLELYLQAGRGLAAIHARELVHRDVKPSNLLVDGSGRVRVSDLGLARLEHTGVSSDAGRARAPRSIGLDATATDGEDGDREGAAVTTAAAATTTGAGARTADGAATTVDAPANAHTPGRATPDGLLASPLTAAGAVVGTPRYMAPEQHRGAQVTRAADQFAFCVALWEGVHGEHPFADADLATLRAAVQAGQRRPAPGGRGVPAWLARALVRGLATEPAARWPSMTALVDVLERTPRRRRAIAAIGGAVLALGASAVALTIASAPAAAVPCRGVTEPVDQVWSAARAAAIEPLVVAADPTQGATRWRQIAGALDRQAAGWRAMALDVCRANRVLHRESDTLHERRSACLERRLGELRASANALAASPGPAAIDRAAASLARMAPLDVCADNRALMALTPPPDDLGGRAAVAAIDAEVDAILAALAIGAEVGLVERAAALVARARAVGHGPALARALRIDAEVQFDVGGRDGSVATLRELAEVAEGAHDDELAAWAWPHLLQELVQSQGKGDEAATLLPVARAAIVRAGNDLDDRVKLTTVTAIILHATGRPAEARAALATARELVLSAGASPAEPRIAGVLGDLEFQAASFELVDGHPELAEPRFRRAVELTTAGFGADHLETAITLQSLGESLRWQGKLDEALVTYQESARIREARSGESAALASTLVSIGSTFDALRRPAEGVAPLERAIRIFRAAGPTAQRDVAVTNMTTGTLLTSLGRHPEARARLDESIAAFATLGRHDSNHGIAYVNRGDLEAKSGDCAAAVTAYRRAAEIFTEHQGPTHAYNVYALTGMAACLVKLRRHDEALAAIDRALAIPVGPGEAPLVAQLRADRVRALKNRDR